MKVITQRPNGTTKVATVNNEPSKTQQQFKDEVDVNNILKKYASGTPISHLNRQTGHYIDVSNIPDYQQALNQVIYAQTQFNQLPSTIRNRFQNDPQQLLEFVKNNKNREEAITLGLIPKPQTPNEPNEPKLKKQKTTDTSSDTNSNSNS